jgi:cation diffusion facilitator family transporter
MMESDSLTAEREKRSAALSSVIAAVALTTFKIIVGLMTGSLGILSEAAHSGLDLVAALITFFAVRFSGKPADTNHTYGHGKIENLSALAETLLLLITCAWIIYEALQRLFVKDVDVDISIWAFLVMGISIVIDFSRSRVLLRAAKKHSSQALEADGLHFQTDIWSSSVVIAGLIAVKLGESSSKIAFLKHADAVAALGVAIIVVWVSLQLGKRTIDALLDSAPAGLPAEIERVAEAIPGIIDCHHVRVRGSGADLFADVHVVVDGQLSMHEAHQLSERVEEAVRQIAPGIDVTVHMEDQPIEKDTGEQSA